MKAKNAEAKALRDTFLGDGFEGEIKLVLLDLETTGLIYREHYPRIVEVAAKNMITGETFSTLVNPGMNIPADSTKIHNITDQMVEACPMFERVGQMLIEWTRTFSCDKDVIVFIAHNMTKFDKPILDNSLLNADIPLPNNWRFADSLDLFKNMLPNLGPKNTKPYGLMNLHLRLLKREYDNAHRAMGDIEALEACLHQVFGCSVSDHANGN